MNLPGLPYGSSRLPAPAGCGDFEVLDSTLDAPPLDGAGIDAALARPMDAEPLEAIARAARRIHLVVPDATRAAGTRELVAATLRALKRGGVEASRVGVVFALGLHRAPTAQERAALLGEWDARLEVVECRPDLESDRLDLGRTSRGTPIWLGRHALEAEALVLVGSIGLHYFAGYTGGRKAVLPGLAAGDSIRANHLRVLGEAGGRDPRVGPGRLDDNPVHLDMEEAAERARPAYVVNSVTDDAGRVVALFTGHWRAAHRAGCEWVAARRILRLRAPRPIVVASAGGHPKDINLIQSHKAMEHVQAAVSEGGVLVLAAACREGAGSASFSSWMALRGSLGEFERRLRARYEVYGQTAYALAAKLARFRIVLVSDLPAPEVEALGLVAARDLADAVARARERAGGGPGYWVPHAGSVLLRLA